MESPHRTFLGKFLSVLDTYRTSGLRHLLPFLKPQTLCFPDLCYKFVFTSPCGDKDRKNVTIRTVFTRLVGLYISNKLTLILKFGPTYSICLCDMEPTMA